MKVAEESNSAGSSMLVSNHTNATIRLDRRSSIQRGDRIARLVPFLHLS